MLFICGLKEKASREVCRCSCGNFRHLSNKEENNDGFNEVCVYVFRNKMRRFKLLVLLLQLVYGEIVFSEIVIR